MFEQIINVPNFEKSKAAGGLITAHWIPQSADLLPVRGHLCRYKLKKPGGGVRVHF